MKYWILCLLAIGGLSARAQMRDMPMAAGRRMRTREPFRQIDPARPHTIIYHLYITDSTVNYTGRRQPAIAVNGSLPGPTLEFTEGDTAEVHIHNKTMMATSVHWHGLIVPNRYDGVPYLTSAPIGPMKTYTAVFPIVQNGTYWYHSHTMLQEQIGLYGAIVIHKRQWTEEKEQVVLLSDWTDEAPYEVQRSLHYATDWYAIRKGSVQDYAAAIKAGRAHTKLVNEWKRMLAMDVSDVAYDKFLVNGKPEETQAHYTPGDKVRLRIINGSSSTYFWLQWAGGKITVVATDGQDVEPVEVDRLIVGVSETYDVVVTLPADSSYAFRATSEDRTGSATLWLGQGPKRSLPPLKKLDYFEGMQMMNGMMNASGGMKKGMEMKMSNQAMDMNAVMYPGDPGTPLNYGMLRATTNTTLPGGAPVKEYHFNLTGNMNRYTWTINNKAVSETDKILIRHGDNVRVILYNGTMMRHPMHLHGHFFRVLNGQGGYSPLKNVVDILPMETDTLEFAANSDSGGDWYFHCHILYHMMSGMGRIFHYEDSPPNPEVPDAGKAIKKVYADDREIRPMARAGLESNGSDGEVQLSNTRYRFQSEWRIGTDSRKGYETESHIGRYLGQMQYWLPYAGWDFRYRSHYTLEKNLFGQADTKDHRNVLCAGVQYTLPLFLVADARVDSRGKFRLQLGREDVPVTSRLRFNFMVNTDREYMAGFRYIITKYIGLSTHYDSDMGWGGGLTFNY
ncbi:MAG TPA: multicopper oxidase domain-containing protein [Puia sp.]|uniref:multicopper oxidase domain-containing protein n=1 Tax=Puia sp. TaxID=2045100 RepID=UPI002BFBCC77|nr:multicopper oxidase domain-containing protein [Puia sp.]HVU98083.1 multicopper oxidase domain-containing protein [Puia sp.]